MMKVKPVKLGKTERMSFSHIDEVISMPNLIEVQKNSYQWFLDEGLKEVFHDIGTIEDLAVTVTVSKLSFSRTAIAIRPLLQEETQCYQYHFRHFGVRSGIGYVGAGLYTFRIQWFSGYGSRILYSL